MAHATTKDISQYIDHEAKKSASYGQDSSPMKMVSRIGTAEAIIFMLILELDPDVRAKKIKEIHKAIA
jgi:hypothetical protein